MGFLLLTLTRSWCRQVEQTTGLPQTGSCCVFGLRRASLAASHPHYTSGSWHGGCRAHRPLLCSALLPLISPELEINWTWHGNKSHQQPWLRGCNLCGHQHLRSSPRCLGPGSTPTVLLGELGRVKALCTVPGSATLSSKLVKLGSRLPARLWQL